MNAAYEGYEHEVESGNCAVRHRVESDEILLVIDHGNDGMLARLTPEQARKLATTLLRDVALIVDGTG